MGVSTKTNTELAQMIDTFALTAVTASDTLDNVLESLDDLLYQAAYASDTGLPINRDQASGAVIEVQDGLTRLRQAMEQLRDELRPHLGDRS
ncbi:hypothetical protein DANDELION_51 [Mycobacterium phage Dandelion]|uniref:Uncharacterized protein n=1 Tax=Mycobacterium phage Dandelion TaxID=1074305 RepID=G1JW03_9CAUD|nr:hypothetical protein DANDELION_51 [Mycobacterium phage Dandelion]AEL97721.1 hypothetical protein DANDELION_51 [Mycobacterium phage Dandelion]